MKREVTPTWYALDDRQFRWLSMFARLKPGVPLKRAEAALQGIYRAASEAYLRELQASDILKLPLPEAHPRLVELASRRLPPDPLARGGFDIGDAQ